MDGESDPRRDVEAPVRSWQRQLAEAIRDPAELLDLLAIGEPDRGRLLEGARAAGAGFRLLVPRAFASRMRRGDPRDPLLLQVLPLPDETVPDPRASRDPLEEAGARLAPGVLAKYQGRALAVTTGVCAIHCRYCFRRHYPYSETPRRGLEIARHLQEAFTADPDLEEVILSGGDPWAMAESEHEALWKALDADPRVRRIRVHTRLPLVLPDRVDPRLLSLVAGTRATVYVVVHANHPAELSPEAMRACRDLRRAGAVLLNQAVLLRGVNDDLEILVSLSRALIEVGILPYYLHLLDPVEGAMHFDVPEAEGRRMVLAMRSRLPGYAVPALVREVPGAPSKLRV